MECSYIFFNLQNILEIQNDRNDTDEALGSYSFIYIYIWIRCIVNLPEWV